MIIQNAYLVGTSQPSQRLGEPALIVGVVLIIHDDGEETPSFFVRYPDGEEKHIAIENSMEVDGWGPYYQVISERDVREGKIPAIR